MKIVCAGAAHYLHDSSCIMSVLGKELTCDDPNFLDRIRVVEWDLAPTERRIVHILSIELEVVRTNASSVCRKTNCKRKRCLPGCALTNTGSREKNVKYIPIWRDRKFRKSATVKTCVDL